MFCIIKVMHAKMERPCSLFSEYTVTIADKTQSEDVLQSVTLLAHFQQHKFKWGLFFFSRLFTNFDLTLNDCKSGCKQCEKQLQDRNHSAEPRWRSPPLHPCKTRWPTSSSSFFFFFFFTLRWICHFHFFFRTPPCFLFWSIFNQNTKCGVRRKRAGDEDRAAELNDTEIRDGVNDSLRGWRTE